MIRAVISRTRERAKVLRKGLHELSSGVHEVAEEEMTHTVHIQNGVALRLQLAKAVSTDGATVLQKQLTRLQRGKTSFNSKPTTSQCQASTTTDSASPVVQRVSGHFPPDISPRMKSSI